LRKIRKGTRIIEYLGERMSHAASDARYENRDPDDNHTFLFIVDKRTVIDAAVDGNDARFINHGCDANCESEIENRRVFIDAIKTIQPGEELNYDYALVRDEDDDPDVDAVFACRCGAVTCRGSMLEPRKAFEAKAKKKRAKSRASRRGSASRPGKSRDGTVRGKRAVERPAKRKKNAKRPTRSRRR
jgi:hypothetical protein